MLQFILPACDHAAHTNPLLQGWASRSSNWKIKPLIFEFLWTPFCVLAAFSSASVLYLLALLLLSCKVAVPATSAWRCEVVVWWRQPSGRPEAVSQEGWCGHGNPFPCPAGPCHWLMYEQLSGEVTVYYTLCFSPCFCRLQLCSVLFFLYAFPIAKIPYPTVITAPYFHCSIGLAR